MIANYPTKLWYVGATSAELATEPLTRRILDHDIVFWRGADGTAYALADRCAHRGFPLSDGFVDGNRLICGYHGCAYLGDGRCDHVTTQHSIPSGMSVRAYPVTEQAPFVWIWVGTPSYAAAARPPTFPWLSGNAWTSFERNWRVSANYLMIHEHLLDFSYAPVVHGNDLPAGVDKIPPASAVEVTETTVSYRRTLPPAPLTDWEQDATGLDPGREYWRSESGLFASPALHVQKWEITSDGDVLSNIRTHALTPETSTTTHIFQQASRNYALTDGTVTSRLRTFVDSIAERDTTILERVAEHSGYGGWRSGVEFQADAAALRARRVVRVMLDQEAGRAPIRPGWKPIPTTNQPDTAPEGAKA